MVISTVVIIITIIIVIIMLLFLLVVVVFLFLCLRGEHGIKIKSWYDNINNVI